jgi:6-phospho-beta-glucosidase
MKITVIGGGSSYTPELVGGFLAKIKTLPLTELWLMDIDEQRLAIVGGLARRMADAQGTPFKVVESTDRVAALTGASYVITQLRVGRMAARREDEYLGLRHGLVGQETTGVGGFANALRTIPVILDIAEDIRKYAPGALLLNFANPAGLVTEALSRYAKDTQAVGVCNVGITAKMHFLDLLEKTTGSRAESGQANLDTLGLNHLTWHRGFRVNGKDVWPQLFPAYLEEVRAGKEDDWDLRTIEVLGMVPNYYLKYFYYTEDKVKDQLSWPPSRAEEVMEIEKGIFQRYADPMLSEAPPELMKRGGAYYSELATQVVDDHFNDRGGIHVVNVRNDGAVANWPEDWVIEIPSRVDRSGVHPIPAAPLPPAQFALVSAVKMYELLAVEAAVHGDRKAAYEALLAHPLGPKADRIEPFLDDLLKTNREFLPRFFS